VPGPSEDQAAGLRRLRTRRPLRSIAFVGAAGCRQLVDGIANELAARRHRVLVLDAGDEAPDHAGAPGDAPDAELLDIDRLPARRAGNAAPPVRLSAHAFAARAASRPGRTQAVAALLDACEPAFTQVLIHLPAGDEAQALAWLDAAADRVFVLTPSPSALRHAYALIKHLPPRTPAARLHVAVIAARDANEVRQLFENLLRTSQRFLSAAPELLGAVTGDAPEAASGPALSAMVDRIENWPAACGNGFAALLARAGGAAALVAG
jgi:hypothetical protein